jgi:hypothetical protein
MPNERHTFTVSLDVSCAPCHTADDAAAREASLKSEILNGLLALKSRLQSWAKTTYGDVDLWDFSANIPNYDDANGNPKVAPDQKAVPIELKRARQQYYFIAEDKSFGVHNSVYTRYMLDIANQNLDSLNVPRSVPRSTASTQTMLQIVNQDLKRSAKASLSEVREP